MVISTHTPDHKVVGEFWEHIKAKASANIGHALSDAGPETEDQVKCHLVYALRHTDWKTNAEVFVEAVEWMVAYLMLKHKHETHSEPVHRSL